MILESPAPDFFLPSLLISDLHLSDADQGGLDWFRKFLNRIDTKTAKEVFILGDLFDYWVGPKQLKIPAYAMVADALRDLTDRGVRLTLFRGNRDGYFEEGFEEHTGGILVPDFYIRSLGNRRVVLTHGDLLCTRDRSYQRFRKVLRSRPVTWLSQRLPLPWALAAARGLRRHSERVVPKKYPEEKSLVLAEIQNVLKGWGADTLICGHVHERREEEVPLGEGKGKLIVLPPFEPGCPVLYLREDFVFQEFEKIENSRTRASGS